MLFGCEKYPSLTVCYKEGYIKFTYGSYETEDKELIEVLRGISDITEMSVSERKPRTRTKGE